MNMLKNRKIVIVSHVFATGPAQALEEYLVNRVKRLLFIGHPFPSYASDIRSFYKRYENSVLIKEKKTFSWKLPELLMWFKDIFYTIFWILYSRETFDLYVGVNNLNAFTGLLLRKIRKVKTVVFYTIDYVPHRFKNRLLNSIYHWSDSFCIKHCDSVWNLSSVMIGEREKKGVPKIYRIKQIRVPIGTDLSVSPLSLDEIEKFTIVYMGHLLKERGLELLVESLPQLKKSIPRIRLVIMGVGPFEGQLRQRIEELALSDQVEFTGFIKSHRNLQERLRRYTLGIAPYVDDEETYTRYTDPGKPKVYLAAGLPVIITRVPEIAEEIAKRPMGIAINYNKEELTQAIITLLTNGKLYQEYRQNAIKFASSCTWDKIFGEALEKTF